MCSLKTIFSLIWQLFCPQRATFQTSWAWKMAQTGISGCAQCCSNLIPSCSTKMYGIKVNLAYFYCILAFFVCPFWSIWANFSHPLNLKRGPNWSVQMPPVLFQPCSTPKTQHRIAGSIFVAKIFFLAYFGHFLAPPGQYLGHSWSGKWAKLVRLDVLSAIPALF